VGSFYIPYKYLVGIVIEFYFIVTLISLLGSMFGMKRWLYISFFSVCCLAIFPLTAWPVYAEDIIALNENNRLGADGAHYWHIQEPGTYRLEVDVSTTHTHAILIDGSNIILDGNLKTITGPGSSPPSEFIKDGAEMYGVRVNNGEYSEGVEVKNLTVKNKYFGVIFEFSSLGLIENISASNNSRGIYVWKGDFNIIRNNVSSNNMHSGIVFDGDQCVNLNNFITENDATNNTEFGLLLWLQCPYSEVTYNTFTGNGNAGIAITGTSDQCIITGNVLNSNTNGLHIARYTDPVDPDRDQRAGNNNQIVSNKADDNANTGIWLYTSNLNEVSYNQTNINHSGIWLTASKDNKIIGNKCGSNQGSGITLVADSIRDMIIGSTGNTISQNNFDANIIMGIALKAGSNDNELNANTANGNQNGIFLEQCQLNKIDDNDACNNTNVGIWLISSANQKTLSNNNITWNTTAGIWLTSSSYNPINNNTCDNNSGHGLALTSGSEHNTLAGNSSNGNGQVGLLLLSESSINTVTGHTANNNATGIEINNSNDNTVTNGTLIGNQGNGLSLESSSGNIISGNDITWNKTAGIWLTSSSYNPINNNTCDNNSGHGLALTSKSEHNTLAGNSANDNGQVGILLLSDSSINTVTGYTANNNATGIQINNSNNNIVTNGTLIGNRGSGVSLESSSGNAITDNDISGNQNFGIGLKLSTSNKVIGNTINNNRYWGIYLNSSNLQTIYNNNFNNPSNNAGFAGTNTGNAWSISKTPEQSIVGGPFLGGNFWGKPDGTGFSQVTADTDLDGLCDAAYTISAGNVDPLPLHEYVQPSELFVNPEDPTCGGKAPCFTSIQDAINRAASGNIIKLVKGSYNDSYALNEDKKLTIQGDWDASFSQQTQGTTMILQPVAVTRGSLKLIDVKITAAM